MSPKKDSIAALLRNLAAGDTLGDAAGKAKISLPAAKAILEKLADQYSPLVQNTLDLSPKKKVNTVPASGSGSATAYIDGGARGNPGPAGCGAVLVDKAGQTITEAHRFLGHATNNVAEYEGLLLALESAGDLGIKRIEIRSDSLLLVQQMNGRYKVKSSNLLPLFVKANKMARDFDTIKYVHVPREQNNRADGLANKAMDEGT